jgi:hypothetical protein
MAVAVHPDRTRITGYLAKLADHAEKSQTRAAGCVHGYARGIAAFASERYAEVIAVLEPVLDDNPLIGGSNPQRRIVEETYLEACLRHGENDRALAVLDRRNRPSSAFDREQRRRAGQAA